jgi:hypothetical protein
MEQIIRARNILIVLLIVTITACSKNSSNSGSGTPPPPPPPPIDTSKSEAIYTGTFSNGPYGSVSGRAEVIKQDNQYVLALKMFTTSSGPDLHVYLSKEMQPINFIDLGKLRQNSGDQLYSITPIPDFSQYKYALIHCQQFNHLFGSTQLK